MGGRRVEAASLRLEGKGPLYDSEMHFRVACVVDGLSGKMCDEAIAYDLAQPFI